MPASTFEDIMKFNPYHDAKEESETEDTQKSFSIFKTDDDKRLVFGWASVSITVDGEQLEDRQKDMIDPEDLEEAAYEYVLKFRDTGEEHISTMRKKGKLVESCVFTEEKQRAMGIPEGILPVAWWIGFKIEDDDAWARVKNGTYRMFSIEGKANREPVEKANPYHDELGRFSSGPGGGGVQTRTAPSLKSGKDFDEYVEKNGLKTIYRGYSADTPEHLDEYEESIKTGSSALSGDRTSALGKGVYFADDATEAEGYMNRRKDETGDKYGRVTTAALDVGAKTGDYREFEHKKFEAESDLNTKAIETLGKGGTMEEARAIADQAMEIRRMSVAEYAATQGYDAVYDKNTGYTVVTNQNALVVKVNDVSKSATSAKSFSEITKANPYHGKDGRFTSANGCSKGGIVPTNKMESVRAQIASLPDCDEEGNLTGTTGSNTCRNPIQQAGEDAYSKVQDKVWDMEENGEDPWDDNHSSYEDVKVADLTALQPFLYRDHLEGIMDSGKQEFHTASGKKDDVCVAKVDGQLFIFGGHHRCCLAMMAGNETIKARVNDFDAT